MDERRVCVCVGGLFIHVLEVGGCGWVWLFSFHHHRLGRAALSSVCHVQSGPADAQARKGPQPSARRATGGAVEAGGGARAAARNSRWVVPARRAAARAVACRRRRRGGRRHRHITRVKCSFGAGHMKG